jgi:acetolactate synthase-1/2/3 large subunit
VIAGDRAFQLNIRELQPVVRNQISLKIIINNNCLGMIRQFKNSYFEGRYQSTYSSYDALYFTEIAKAYGIPAITIEHTNQISFATEWL